MRLLDLSVKLTAGIASDPPSMLPEIDYISHDQGAAEFMQMFPGLKRDDLLEGKGAANERVRITTHNGTHMDAPLHFHPTMDSGQPALSIDEVPLEWCHGDGVKLDFRDKPDGYVCTAADVQTELDRIGYDLKPFDIVLVNTAAGAMYGSDRFLDSGCGMGREATLFLLDRGVRVTGIDGWSWDAPFSYTRQRFEKTGDASLIWEGHKAGAMRGYCHMEKLTNLEQLPPFGFKVSCFPIKIARASAGWVRAVAHLDDRP
ncbi:cyclase family protein [Agrobacterium tumefaciens]|uniref:Cyclase n=1 Tax=Agrobacterium tumefaciens TaxID=358 RepID=A0A2L2LM44_AGRTU|nr:cyclase family protein [Agrobacterium tumefaciens]AVH45404.1 cyclase [Agrobacterium tumefaciens]NSY99133.1 cyclase family protein [Agrobacterium tumefaciens]